MADGSGPWNRTQPSQSPAAIVFECGRNASALIGEPWFSWWIGLGWNPLDSGHPERFPGRAAELAADLVGRPVKDPAAILDLEQRGLVAIRGRDLLEHLLDVGITGGPRTDPTGGQPVDHQVAGDPEQPAPKRPTLRVGIEPLDGDGHRAKDLLHEIGGIGRLQTPGAGQAFDQGRVNRHELAPGVPVARILQTNQKARPRCRRVGHAIPPAENTGGAGISFSVCSEGGKLGTFWPSQDRL